MADGEPVLPVSSSTPTPLIPEALECYRGVLDSLTDAGIPFAVAGAYALHRHTGIWRTTKDLDLVLEAKSVPAALFLLHGAGFETRIEDPVWLAKAIRGEHFVDLITALGNALLVIDASWIERARPYEVLGRPSRVLSAEEMIASKIFICRRERFDGADVAHLIRACGGRLDWARVQHLIEPHWEMLLWSLLFFRYAYPAHMGLVPASVWNGLIYRLQDNLRHPKSDEPFRGTLIDPNMFAIDVDDWGERDLYTEYRERHPFLLNAIESTQRDRK
jgi:Nucleotidyl transferase of unknown function (DUF2204)